MKAQKGQINGIGLLFAGENTAHLMMGGMRANHTVCGQDTASSAFWNNVFLVKERASFHLKKILLINSQFLQSSQCEDEFCNTSSLQELAEKYCTYKMLYIHIVP